MKRSFVIAGLMNMLLAGAAMAAPPAYLTRAVADARRPAADTSRDAQRLPAELMEFAGIKPGMTVVDLLPGGGYFTRPFANAVGPKGHVYAYFGPQYDDRLTKAGTDPNHQFVDIKAQYSNVGTIHGPLNAVVTPERVDVVWTADNYHDVHNKSYAADVPGMNKAIFNSLKHGGVYVIVDHRAAKGAGPEATEKLHRVDEDIVKKEVQAAGFQLVAESNLLTLPRDDGAKRVFEEGEHDHTDQMVLKFRKP